jgi:hypothetical protein
MLFWPEEWWLPCALVLPLAVLLLCPAAADDPVLVVEVSLGAVVGPASCLPA